LKPEALDAMLEDGRSAAEKMSETVSPIKTRKSTHFSSSNQKRKTS